jgi:peptide-methionine (S)-S-oxide reductase
MAAMRRLLAFVLILAAGAAIAVAAGQRGERAPDQVPAKATGPVATAVFAGGCFWSVESAFEHMAGVISATSGYSGGRSARPTYAQVSAGGTGHLEAVRVEYDPRQISYGRLVAGFLRSIDPTDASGQFCDRGEQYRTAIFVADAAERRAAEAARAEAARLLGATIATTVRAAAPFYAAEDYHQDYARRNPVHYNLYRRGCGRDAALRRVWSRVG